MSHAFFSIVTISFNQAVYLRQCVDSVISQKSDDVEYIVVDPGSTDGSREILQSYGDVIDHLVFDPDIGPSDGLNKGFSQAAGEVGFFLNSDDFLLPGALNRMRSIWRKRPDIEVLLGGAWMVDREGHPIRELRATLVTLDDLLRGRVSMIQQGMSFRMSSFREVGGFNPGNRTCWDYELLCAMLRRGARVATTTERLGVFRIYEESLSGGAGGAAHELRYREDLERVHREITGKPRASVRPSLGALERAARHFQRPGNLIRLLRDRLSPAHMQNRWQYDMNPAVNRKR